MQWSDLDFENEIWIQHDTKNGTTHLTPLSPQAIKILKSREQTSEWVFPSNHNQTRGSKAAGHAKPPKDMRWKVQEASGVTGWTCHDLRRTGRTILSRLRIAPDIRERVLNHKQRGVVGVYDQYDYLPEKREALNKLAEEIDRILGVKLCSRKIMTLRRCG
jgi:integrase